MHRGHCTPQDSRFYRRLSGEDDKVGVTERSQEAQKRDWEKYCEGRLTVDQAMVLDTERHCKLRELMKQ